MTVYIENYLSVITIVISAISLVISFGAVKYARNQMLLSIAPELWTNGVVYNTIEHKVSFDLSNKGHTAGLQRIKILQGDIIHESSSFPIDLDCNSSIYLYFRYNGKEPMKDVQYKIKIFYTNKNNNKCSVFLTCKNGRCNIEH